MPTWLPTPAFAASGNGRCNWKPGQRAAGIEPRRRVHELRHTFATFALRAGISTFDLSRYMGTSLAMIDRHYGHLARDGREPLRLAKSEAASAHGATSRTGGDSLGTGCR